MHAGQVSPKDKAFQEETTWFVCQAILNSQKARGQSKID